MLNVLHALCNAHHLRELKALVEIEKEAWAGKMQALLRQACHLTNVARAHGRWLKPASIAALRRRFEAILVEGPAFHEAQPALDTGRRKRRTGHNGSAATSRPPIARGHRPSRPTNCR